MVAACPPLIRFYHQSGSAGIATATKYLSNRKGPWFSDTPLTTWATLRYNKLMSEHKPDSRQRDPQHKPPSRMPADHLGALIAALAMMVIGWVGLYLLVTATRPRIGAELWSFFLLLHLAITGTVLPLVRYFNVLLTPADSLPPPGGVIVRQSVWIGLYVVICAWLQLLRALSLPIGLFLPVAFIGVEVFLRLRETDTEI